MVQVLRKTAWQFLKKLNIELTYDSLVLLLCIYPRERKTCTHKNVHHLHLCQKFPLGRRVLRETKDSPRCQKGKRGINWGQYFQLFRLNSWTSDVQLHKHKPILSLILASHLWRAQTWGRRGNIWFCIPTDCYLKVSGIGTENIQQPYYLPTWRSVYFADQEMDLARFQCCR